MPANAWLLIKETVTSFIEDEALSRGAAISFYTVTSIAPVLYIVVAIAGLAFGRDAARGAIADQVSGLMGKESADLLQNAIKSAADTSSGVLATVVGLVTLVVAASGVFGEMQSALNAFWKVEPRGTTVSRLIRARAASLGLVAALGFLLLVSLVISAGLSALGNYINAFLPFADFILEGLNFLISFVLISVLFAAIYKVLPDKRLAWRDVLVGAVATALLFTLGKFLSGLYIGSSAIASSYGAAGALILVLLWVYSPRRYSCWGRSSPRSMPATMAASGRAPRLSHQGAALACPHTPANRCQQPKRHFRQCHAKTPKPASSCGISPWERC
jgi:membrane protein